MAYKKKGYNANSLANLSKGSNLPKLATKDSKSQKLAELILNEEVEYKGAMISRREALLREQLEKALEGDLRSCQFLIELAGYSEQEATTDKSEELTPLEKLYSKMIPTGSNIIDRRRSERLKEKEEST